MVRWFEDEDKMCQCCGMAVHIPGKTSQNLQQFTNPAFYSSSIVIPPSSTTNTTSDQTQNNSSNTEPAVNTKEVAIEQTTTTEKEVAIENTTSNEKAEAIETVNSEENITMNMDNMGNVGFGTWFQDENGETDDVELITNALVHGIDEVGYRLLNTANNYKSTETFFKVVPELIEKHSSETFYIIAKGDTLEDFQHFRDQFNQTNVQLIFMIHYAAYTLAKNKLFEIWNQLHQELETNPGQMKALAVSDIFQEDLQLLLDQCEENGWTKPMMNEIEISPLFPQYEFVEYMQNNNIIPVAVSSLRGLGYAAMYPQTFQSLSEDTPYPTLISSWLQQRNIMVFFCSKTPERMESNLKNKVTLTEEQMKTLKTEGEVMMLALTDVCQDAMNKTFEGPEVHDGYPTFDEVVAEN